MTAMMMAVMMAVMGKGIKPKKRSKGSPLENG